MFHSIILVAGVRGVWTYWMGGSADGVMSQVSIIRRTNVPLRRDTFLLHIQFQEDTIGTSSDDPIMDKDIHAV